MASLPLAAQSAPAPAPSTGARFLPGVSPAVAVDDRIGTPMVRPTLAGRGLGPFLLDTGASTMVIARDVATELGLERIGSEDVTGVGGAVRGDIVRGGPFQLGPLEIDELTFVALDLADLRERSGVAIEGIVGFDVFAESAMVLDLPARTLELHPPGFEPSGLERFPMAFDDRLPVVSVELDGRVLRAHLDTGSRNWFTLHADTVARLGLAPPPEATPARETESFGIGGGQPTREQTAIALRVLGETFADVRIKLSLAARGAFAEAAVDANLGIPAFWHRRLLLDYAGNRLAVGATARPPLRSRPWAQTVLDEFSGPMPRATSGGRWRVRDDAVVGSASTLTPTWADGVLKLAAELDPAKGRPGFAEYYLDLDPDGAVDLSAFTGLAIEGQLEKGRAWVRLHSDDDRDFDACSAVLELDATSGIAEIDFKEMAPQWSPRRAPSLERVVGIGVWFSSGRPASARLVIDRLELRRAP
ncbi:MAG: aspartyl protease family protein [Planctomycetota bacterium]